MTALAFDSFITDHNAIYERQLVEHHFNFAPDARLIDREIPCSELAMHCRVAGKIAQRIAVTTDKRYAYVLCTDGSFVDGLVGEVVPFGARAGLE